MAISIKWNNLLNYHPINNILSQSLY